PSTLKRLSKNSCCPSATFASVCGLSSGIFMGGKSAGSVILSTASPAASAEAAAAAAAAEADAASASRSLVLSGCLQATNIDRLMPIHQHADTTLLVMVTALWINHAPWSMAPQNR